MIQWLRRCVVEKEFITVPVLALPKHKDLYTPDIEALDDKIACAHLQEVTGLLTAGFGDSKKRNENCCLSHRKFLKVVFPIIIFHPYMKVSCIKNWADHEALRWSLTMTEANVKLPLWRLMLSEFQLDIVYRPRVMHQTSDASLLFKSKGENKTPLKNKI